MLRPHRFLLAIMAILGCADTSGPDTAPQTAHGPPYAYGYIDGSFFEMLGGTLGRVYISPTDTILSFGLVTSVVDSTFYSGEVYLAGWQLGRNVLGDSGSGASARFWVHRELPSADYNSQSFYTSSATPGRLVIADINRADSLIAGTYTFTARNDSVPGVHHDVSLRFRMLYTVIPLPE